MSARGSFTYSSTRDPQRALSNRWRRDEILAGRLRIAAEVTEVSDVAATEPLVDAFVREHAAGWISRSDRGDVAARRRDDNERRLDQWRRYAPFEPRAREGTLELACECDRPGCTEVVSTTFADAVRRPRRAHDG